MSQVLLLERIVVDLVELQMRLRILAKKIALKYNTRYPRHVSPVSFTMSNMNWLVLGAGDYQPISIHNLQNAQLTHDSPITPEVRNKFLWSCPAKIGDPGFHPRTALKKTNFRRRRKGQRQQVGVLAISATLLCALFHSQNAWLWLDVQSIRIGSLPL